MYVVKRLGKGLLNLFLVVLAFVAFFTVVGGPLILASEVHGAWGLLYTPHVILGLWIYGEE